MHSVSNSHLSSYLFNFGLHISKMPDVASIWHASKPENTPTGFGRRAIDVMRYAKITLHGQLKAQGKHP